MTVGRTLVLGHDQGDCDPMHFYFDRIYAALNSVVPGAEPGSLLGFYDAEYHVFCPLGQPLLSSIGGSAFEYAASDDGVHWTHSRELLHFAATDANTGFPTLVSLAEPLCARITCPGFSDPNATLSPASGSSQQVTNATGWLYYRRSWSSRSSRPDGHAAAAGRAAIAA